MDAFILQQFTLDDASSILHYHDYWELILFSQATSVTCIIGNHLTKIQTDTALFLVPPGMLHGWCLATATPASGLVKQIIFHYDLFSNSLLSKNQFFHLKQLLKAGINAIHFSNYAAQTAQSAFKILQKENNFRGLIILMQLLTSLSIQKKWEILNHDSDKLYSKNINSNIQGNTVMDFLNLHFKEEITLKKMAYHMNMSEATLARFFKMQTGKCFTDLLIEKRLSYAIKLLVETPSSIQEIAYQSGFNHVTHFNRLFKTQTGFSPSMYKKFLLSTKIA